MRHFCLTFLSATPTGAAPTGTSGIATIVMLFLICAAAVFILKMRGKKPREYTKDSLTPKVGRPFPIYFKVVVLIDYILLVIGTIVYGYINYLHQLEWFSEYYTGMDMTGSEPRFGFTLLWLLLPAVLLLPFTAIYYLPYLIAHNRNHPNETAIFVLNLFAGWTVLGWFGALVWTFINPQIKSVEVESAADELKKYKELLDSGAITEEEYSAKKQTLLKKE